MGINDFTQQSLINFVGAILAEVDRLSDILKIAVCDDDKKFADRITRQIKEITLSKGILCDITNFYDGIELVSYCKKHNTDILILDIDMPVMNGFEAVDELRKSQPEIAVIFITAHNEFAYQAYDYQPFWFVSKSDLCKLGEVLLKLINKINLHRAENNFIVLKLNNIVHINAAEIMYLKSERNYINAYKVNGEVFKFRGAMKDTYEQLEDRGFIYVIRGCIVNCRYIEKIDKRKNIILMKNNDRIHITSDAEAIRKIDAVYGKFMRESRW